MFFIFLHSVTHRYLHSFPTRRSSDLSTHLPRSNTSPSVPASNWRRSSSLSGDRKSTRLNSSHLGISYAVFCLKKKKNVGTVRFVSASKRGSTLRNILL